jgi:dTDP-4-dehydrorhamnose 3,5-epimerase
MKIEKTKFNNCVIITPDIYKDYRGEYIEIFNEQKFNENFPDIHFVQDDISLSYKDVLRGFHGDTETWKLIQCLHGRFQFVVIDNRESSLTYGETLSVILDDKTRQMVLVPPNFGNAHLCLSDSCLFHYKQNTYYKGAENQFTLSWELFNNWAISNPILSNRDKSESPYGVGK